MKITIIAGAACAYSIAALKIVRSAEFKAWLKENKHTITAADINSAAGKAALKACGCKTCKTPVFCCVPGGTEKPYSVSYRPAKGAASAADLIAALNAACESCNWQPQVCPTCKRALSLLPFVLALSMLTGCVGTVVPTPYGRGYRLSMFQLTEASLAWRGTNQVFELNAYKSSADADAMRAVVDAAVKAGIAGATKVP